MTQSGHTGVLPFGWYRQLSFLRFYARHWDALRLQARIKNAKLTIRTRVPILAGVSCVKLHILRAVIFFRLVIFWHSLRSTAQRAEQVTAPAKK
jgi:hypothetical protein